MNDINKLCKVLEDELRNLEMWILRVQDNKIGPFERGYYEGKREALIRVVNNLKPSFSFKDPKEDI